MDWDDAYANGKYIADADRIAAAWPVAAAAFRSSTAHDADIAYGRAPRERLDLFYPSDAPKGLFVFVHGGYWMAFGKYDWSHFAQGAVDAGWAAAVPEYVLCPEASITEIGKQIARAIQKAASLIEGPIVLCGHSAGGHLVTRVMCGAALTGEVAARVRRVVGISGLYDLRPLLHTQMNKTLQLTEEEAARESPALLTPLEEFDMVAWVGADERPAFLQQPQDLKSSWEGQKDVRVVTAPGRHHFNVIDELKDASSPLMQAALAR